VNSAPVSVVATPSLFPPYLETNVPGGPVAPSRPELLLGYFRQYCEKSDWKLVSTLQPRSIRLEKKSDVIRFR